MIRLLRIELRRNALLALLPVVAALWLASPIARHLHPIALWPDRSTDVQSSLQGLCPFTAGVAAWMAYRERRRGAGDLLATTPLNPALRTFAVLTATTVWAVLGYVTGAVVMLVITARQATWGGPNPWPLLVGLLAVIASAAVGFAVGRLAPSRFTAPLTAIGLLGLLAIGAETAHHGPVMARIGPLYPSINLTLSVFYPVRTDLAIVQLLCLAGILTGALGTTLLHTGNRRIGVAGVAAGAALAGSALALIGTAHVDQQGAVMIPALDTVDIQRPLDYRPVCGTGALPVCVHPAFAAKLSIVDGAVNALVRPLLDTPGAPARAVQRPIESMMSTSLSANPPELAIQPLFIQGDTLGPDKVAGVFQTTVALALVDTHGTHPRFATDAQRAVALYLIQQAGGIVDPVLLPENPALRTAADHLGALPDTARHAWLAEHITDVRSGALTLPELP